MTESRRIRSFRCADNLWRSLEDESDERGITIDALITEALWSYLRSAPEFSTESSQQARMEVMQQATVRSAQRRADPLHEGVSGDTSSPPAFDASAEQEKTPVARGRMVRPARLEEAEATLNNLNLVFDDEGRLLDPKTGERVPSSMAEEPDIESDRVPEGERPKLALLFSGNRYDVTGERFLIGRASTGTDLQIRDANVSRKHAAIIFHDGGWFIHDLQSTNGVEFRGRRIHTRRIENDDRYTICDYELILELEA